MADIQARLVRKYINKIDGGKIVMQLQPNTAAETWRRPFTNSATVAQRIFHAAAFVNPAQELYFFLLFRNTHDAKSLCAKNVGIKPYPAAQPLQPPRGAEHKIIQEMALGPYIPEDNGVPLLLFGLPQSAWIANCKRV